MPCKVEDQNHESERVAPSAAVETLAAIREAELEAAVLHGDLLW